MTDKITRLEAFKIDHSQMTGQLQEYKSFSKISAFVSTIKISMLTWKNFVFKACMSVGSKNSFWLFLPKFADCS